MFSASGPRIVVDEILINQDGFVTIHVQHIREPLISMMGFSTQFAKIPFNCLKLVSHNMIVAPHDTIKIVSDRIARNCEQNCVVLEHLYTLFMNIYKHIFKLS